MFGFICQVVSGFILCVEKPTNVKGDKVRKGVRKKREYVGKNLGGGSDLNPLLDVCIYLFKIVIFLVKTKNVPEVLK